MKRHPIEVLPQPPPRQERIAFGAGAKIIGFVILTALLVLAREVLLLAFFSVLIAFALSFPVRWISRVLPRGLAVVLSLLVVGGGLTALGFYMTPVLWEQVQSVKRQAPAAIHKLEGLYDKAVANGPVAELSKGTDMKEQVGGQAGKVIEAGLGAVFPAALGAVEGVFTLVLIIVLAAFLTYQPEVYLRGVRLLVPRSSEASFDEGLSRMGHGLRHWVAGIFTSMLIMGVVTGAGLKIAGIQNWLLLAILTCFGTFIPYLGAIASAVPGLLMGLSQSTHQFMYACIVYLGVHIVEGYIVQPLIMKRAVEIRPALLLLGQAVFGTLLGLFGVIVASPLLVCLQIGVTYFYVERKLGKTVAP
jgi:predicted PurR-regulated permease PerM